MSQEGIGKFCWNELATGDKDKAKAFYGKLLGWTFTDIESHGMTYTKISNGKDEFGGIWEIPEADKDNVPPHWMAYITVQNLKETLEKALDLGASIKVPATSCGDKGSFAIIIDPTGAHIALWECTKEC